MLLVLAVLVAGGIVFHLEDVVPLSVYGATANRSAGHFALAMIGLFVLARIILHMIAIPEDYLSKRSFIFDAEIYERRERRVQYLGYGIGIATLLFEVYKIVLLSSFF